jgi:hypothetical protein
MGPRQKTIACKTSLRIFDMDEGEIR